MTYRSDLGFLPMNKESLRAQARRILAECDIIDTETNWNDEATDAVIEIAVVCGATGEVVLDTLVYTDLPISDRAIDLHGITPDMIEFSPSPQWVINRIITRLEADHQVADYNLRFDVWALSNTASPDTPRPRNTWDPHESVIPWKQENDIMELANRFFSEHLEWDVKGSKFRRLSLARCMEIAGIQRKGTAHRAMSDALAAYELLKFIAEGE